MPTFPTAASFQDVNSDQAIAFTPEPGKDRFSWQGSGISKLGTYQFVKDQGREYLVFSFNYAREETYRFMVLETKEGYPTRFRLTDRLGRELEFKKI